MKITMVIVFYKQKPEESKTFRTLKSSLFSKKELFNEIELILYDNSPVKQDFSPLNYEGIHISYNHDPRNLGIAAAYNYAWAVAKENGSQWLLLLDHDTDLTDDYLIEVLNVPDVSSDIAAVVPKICSENKMISPVYSHSLRPLQEEPPKSGIQEKRPVMAINSGALIRVGFLNELNGFNEVFPLDYLDHWLFFEIYARGKKVLVLDVVLEHELSVMDYSRVPLKRYQSILDAEYNFYQNFKKDLFPSYRAQLAKRFLKQVLTVKNKKIAMYTLKRLFSI
ncbi:glycosyltransferase [Neobacillus sp. OS1-2]|uniref:glycosyltransferase n=1 Tax=Neobacillus sp. OS1-2 TaxID=3070680 RepID=UPI0027DFDF88|nr:glycosyltransferase [Neobacillus sp. OS1-2]WML41208.1 glycosyltransferase [Neobacillus sp. OS1-2]